MGGQQSSAALDAPGEHSTTKPQKLAPKSLPRGNACDYRETTTDASPCALSIKFIEVGCEKTIRFDTNMGNDMNGIVDFAHYLEDDNREFTSVTISAHEDGKDKNIVPFVPNIELFKKIKNMLSQHSFIYRSVCHELICDFGMIRPDIHPESFGELAAHGKQMAMHIDNILDFVNMSVVNITLLHAKKEQVAYLVNEQTDNKTLEIVCGAFLDHILTTQSYAIDGTRRATLYPKISVSAFAQERHDSSLQFDSGGFYIKSTEAATLYEKYQIPSRIRFDNLTGAIYTVEIERLFDDKKDARTFEFFVIKKLVTELEYLCTKSPSKIAVVPATVSLVNMTIDKKRRKGVEEQIKKMMKSLGFACTKVTCVDDTKNDE